MRKKVTGTLEEKTNFAMGIGDLPYYMELHPEEYEKLIPKTGCWIRILIPPPTQFTVPHLSMWFAKPAWSDHRNLAKIITPEGELWVRPHEFQKVKDITQWVGMEPDVEMHYLSKTAKVNEQVANMQWYLQTRGIDKHEATKLLLGHIKDQHFAYFTMHPMYSAFFPVGTGSEVGLYLHTRTK
jgi:hypothetical protein